jgi:hypothetical protein
MAKGVAEKTHLVNTFSLGARLEHTVVKLEQLIYQISVSNT